MIVATLLNLASFGTGPRTVANQSLAYLLELTSSSTPPHVRDVDPAFDCSWRKLALEYGAQIQPWLASDATRMRELHDALELSTKCGLRYEGVRNGAAAPIAGRAVAAAITVVVSPTGSDAAAGTVGAPLKTIGAALAMVRSKRAGARGTAATSAAIELRAGVYHVLETLDLNGADSHLTITSYTGERATISGGRSIDGVKWSRTGCGASMPSGVWCATLSAAQAAASTFNALQVESHAGATTWERATLARFPNANPELGASTTRWRSRGLFLYHRRARALTTPPPPRATPSAAAAAPPFLFSICFVFFFVLAEVVVVALASAPFLAGVAAFLLLAATALFVFFRLLNLGSLGSAMMFPSTYRATKLKFTGLTQNSQVDPAV